MIRRGIIVSYSGSPPATAIVAFAGSVHTDLVVRVPANIDGAEVTPGRGCYVAFDDQTDPGSPVLIAVWDL